MYFDSCMCKLSVQHTNINFQIISVQPLSLDLFVVVWIKKDLEKKTQEVLVKSCSVCLCEMQQDTEESV